MSPVQTLLTTSQAHINTWGEEAENDKNPASASEEFDLHYPCFWPILADFKTLEFNPRGLPLESFGAEEKKRLNPMLIAAYGMYALTNFLEKGDIRGRYNAVSMADWLRENITLRQTGFYAWPTGFDLPFYQLRKPWVSAKTHGLALSLLLRTAAMDNDAKYERAAKKAVKIFMLSVEDGGFTRRFPDGQLGFDEYPAKQPALPLAGQLFGLIGLFDYIKYFDDRMMKTVFSSALDGLKANLPKFDTGKWLLFDLQESQRLASIVQVTGVCQLLKNLAHLTEDEALENVAKKWKAYVTAENVERKFWFMRMKERARLNLFPEKYGIDRELLKDAPN